VKEYNLGWTEGLRQVDPDPDGVVIRERTGNVGCGWMMMIMGGFAACMFLFAWTMQIQKDGEVRHLVPMLGFMLLFIGMPVWGFAQCRRRRTTTIKEGFVHIEIRTLWGTRQIRLPLDQLEGIQTGTAREAGYRHRGPAYTYARIRIPREKDLAIMLYKSREDAVPPEWLQKWQAVHGLRHIAS
jgi:hypothetical protein